LNIGDALSGVYGKDIVLSTLDFILGSDFLYTVADNRFLTFLFFARALFFSSLLSFSRTLPWWFGLKTPIFGTWLPFLSFARSSHLFSNGVSRRKARAERFSGRGTVYRALLLAVVRAVVPVSVLRCAASSVLRKLEKMFYASHRCSGAPLCAESHATRTRQAPPESGSTTFIPAGRNLVLLSTHPPPRRAPHVATTAKSASSLRDLLFTPSSFLL
jgi:hypothetical protein